MHGFQVAWFVVSAAQRDASSLLPLRRVIFEITSCLDARHGENIRSKFQVPKAVPRVLSLTTVEGLVRNLKALGSES